MRIFVTGPTGSGKSTLASKLASKNSLPLFPLDDIHWVRHPNQDVRRSPDERLIMLDQITRYDAWIIEGVQFKWADPAMEHADIIVVLDLPRWQNIIRIFRRFINRRRSQIGNRRTLDALKEEIRWSADYYSGERRMLFEKLTHWPEKLIILQHNQDERLIEKALQQQACIPQNPGLNT